MTWLWRYTLSAHDSECGSEDRVCSALTGGQGSSDTARDLASSFLEGGALLEGEGGDRLGLSSWKMGDRVRIVAGSAKREVILTERIVNSKGKEV